MNGILNIDKPYGFTSYDIVAAVKKYTGVRHVGHAGTLDPMATGVLPVCLGQSTRVVEFLMDTTKTYQAEIELGIDTDTYDVEGTIVKRGEASQIAQAQIESVLASFRGPIMQVPPPYSAVKVRGRPLYHWARAGVVVDSKSRKVMVYDLELTDYLPPVLSLNVVCGKGTYIRSLANDLGEKLGCGATLKSLVRLRCGPFDIKDSYSLSQVEDAFRHGYGEELLCPIDSVLLNWDAVVLNEIDAQKVICGNSISLSIPNYQLPTTNDSLSHGSPNYQLPITNYSVLSSSSPISKLPTTNYRLCRAYSAGGCLLAVLRYEPETSLWHPEKVFL